MRHYSFTLCVVAISALAAHPHAVQNIRILNQEVVVPNGGMTPPVAIQTTPPAYSLEAFKRRLEGVVTVLAEFDIDGNAKVLRVVKGLGFGLDENAIAALQQWRFTPAYRNGRRVSVIANIDVLFNMPNQFVQTINGRTYRLFLAPSEKKDAPAKPEMRSVDVMVVDSAQKPE